MRKIYSEASCVRVWLASDIETARKAFNYIGHMYTNLRNYCAQYFRERGRNDPNVFSNFVGSYKGTFTNVDRPKYAVLHSFQHALNSLLANKWVDRVWIVQEVSVAKTVLLLCGDLELDWRYLEILLVVSPTGDVFLFLEDTPNTGRAAMLCMARNDVQDAVQVSLQDWITIFRAKFCNRPKRQNFRSSWSVSRPRCQRPDGKLSH